MYQRQIKNIQEYKCGSIEARRIESQIKNLENIENKKGYEFNQLKRRIFKESELDYEFKKAIVFRENYINEMEKYKDFANYEQFMEKLESIKNPLEFYEFVSINDLTKDLTYQSDEVYTQQAFNSFIQVLRN